MSEAEDIVALVEQLIYCHHEMHKPGASTEEIRQQMEHRESVIKHLIERIERMRKPETLAV